MRVLVAPELVERNGWSRLSLSCLAWDWRHHSCLLDDGAIDVDPGPPLQRPACFTGRIDFRELEAPHCATGRLLNLFRRDAEIQDTSVPDFKVGDISGCAQQRDVARHECDVIFQVTLAKVSVLNKAPAKCWDDCIPIRKRVPSHQGRHRCPTAPVVTPMPRYPCGRPLRARHPTPATKLMEKPSPVVKRRPAPFKV